MNLKDYSDEELVKKYQESQDYKYLTELFTRHSDVIYRNALRKMKNPADAEDIVQMAYIKMVKDLMMFKATGSIIGWMVQVVIHTSYDRLKSEKSRRNRDKLIMSEREQMTTPKNYELTEMIETHLNKLPEIYKVPITLQILDGLTIKEVSDALEIPEKTIRSQIARGLEKLKASLQSVGVTASVISVGDMIREIQQPMAPEIFKSSQYFNSIYQAKTATSTKLAISTGSKAISLQSVVGISLLVITTLVSIFSWRQYSKMAEISHPKDASSQILQKWDFENTKDLSAYQHLGLVIGEISIAEKNSLNKSNHLKVADESVISLDISKFKLPLKISYTTRVDLPRNGGAAFGQIVFKGNYEKDKKIKQIFGLYETPTTLPTNNTPNSTIGGAEEMINVNCYVDDHNIDFWWNEKRYYFFQGASLDNKKLYLYIKGKAVLDDLKIETIDRSKLPVKSAFENAVTSIIEEAGVEKYKLDKEKLGFHKNSDASPYLLVDNATNLETKLSVNNKELSAYLSEDNKIEWVKPRQKLKLKWDFENTNDLSSYQSIGLLKGSIYLAESKGINNSNGLSVDDETLLEFNIAKIKLPIKVSFTSVKTIQSMDIGIGYGLESLVKGNYSRDQNIFELSGLRESFEIPKINKRPDSKEDYVGVLSHVCYVDENSVDYWVNGQRSSYIQGVSEDNKNIYLSMNKAIIDDLVIESIDKKDLPETSNFEKVMLKVAIKKDASKYNLDKNSLGIDKNSDATPLLTIESSDTFEYIRGVKKKVRSPYLSEAGKVEWVRPRQIVSQKWTFDKAIEMNDFMLIYGQFNFSNNTGIDKSNCVEVGANSLLEIDISQYVLPLKITYAFDSSIPKGKTGGGLVMLKGNYQKDKNILSFSNLCPSKIIDVTKMPVRNQNARIGFFGEWLSAEIYVSEDCIDIWFHGKRTGIYYGSSIDNNKLYLNVKDRSLIDNITIESVKSETIPDISKFKSFAATVPFIKGSKNYYRLETEKEPLLLEKNSIAELGICDSETMESVLGLNKKISLEGSKTNTAIKK